MLYGFTLSYSLDLYRKFNSATIDPLSGGCMSSCVKDVSSCEVKQMAQIVGQKSSGRADVGATDVLMCYKISR